MEKAEGTTVMRIQRIVAVLLAMFVLLAGCNGESSSPTGPDGPVPTVQVYKSKTSAISGRRAEIISRQSRWVEVWDEITASVSPKPALPTVDFENAILIFAAGGELADSCGDIRIESVGRVNGALAVSIVEERRPNCTCPAIVIRPVHVLSAPRAATGAAFEFRIVTINSCS
jgi:hypothetical protein